ncbi:Crp/Fnr family transcriptional regulator [Mucilaginibacter sp. 21P]|uniref:Crp/Fnr family transcriptional regulator n=1 Tax=Mucilaginibacter sp. 21P TaxID=2778902 RepID=UPI001C562E65|nr:Crp/Fnr family transcriptional regulator [Mucilaginibacter sp. 21P]QXV63825.1 Crp/Fnr family transcriptional regulator [Mucilaginibacter sp. 21P]
MSLNGLFPIDRWNFHTESVLGVLTTEEHTLLLSGRQDLQCGKGEVIFREGTVPSGIFLIRSGKVKKYKSGQHGREQIIYVAGPGELIGYHAVLSEDRYPDSAAAMEETQVAFIPKENFLATLSRSPLFTKRLLKAISHEFSVLANSISVIAQQTGPERLAIALIVLREKFKKERSLDEPLTITVPRADLASMAGIAEENVIRLLKEFKQEGILETNARKILIKDLDRLIRRANYS